MHGRGFQFVADVVDDVDEVDEFAGCPTPVTAAAVRRSVAPALTTLHQTVRFCSAPDGTRLAYADRSRAAAGQGRQRLTHIDLDLGSPSGSTGTGVPHHRDLYCATTSAAAAFPTLDVDDFSIDAWVHDRETVVDAAGLDRSPLLGISQGGAVAIELAVRHPERVSRLVTYGALVKGPALRLTRPEHVREARLLE